MKQKQLTKVNDRESQLEKRPVTDREIMAKILKLQTQLNSKMFEFMRDYQQEHNFGRDHMMFVDGSGRKTRLARLRQEVNQLGAALGELVSIFIGENVYEKRDGQGRLLLHCNHCQKETAYGRVIDRPYGLADAYMDGTERLVCSVCKKDTIYPGDERLPKFNSVFRTK